MPIRPINSLPFEPESGILKLLCIRENHNQSGRGVVGVLYILYFLIAIGATTVGSLTGMGGGVIIKPLMDVLHHFDVETIGVLSSITVFSMSIVSIGKQILAKTQIPFQIAIPLSVGSVLGGYLGQGLLRVIVDALQAEGIVTVVQNAVLAVLILCVYFYMRNKSRIPGLHLSGIPISLAVGCFLGICSSFLGYMVTQSELPMRKWVYRFVVATMYFNAGLIPWYILMVNLGLKNNFLLYILPSAVGAYYVVLSKTYIESIPASVEESAKIDGAGVLTIYARLILPMSMPIIACLIVFCAVNQWNAWSDNFYLVSDPKLSTLQYQLYMNLANESSNVTNTTSSSSLLRSKATTELGLRYALSMLTVLPILLVYPFMQKYFVKGIMLGAVKG